MRILLVEDESDLASQVLQRIEHAGYEIDRVDRIEEAIGAIDRCAYSLALLDRRLPDGDGVSLLRRIRSKQPKMRILIISALDAVDDKVQGLEAGADDYLTKPFALDEMIARIRAHLREHGTDSAPPIELGALSFDPLRRSVKVGDRPVPFSRRELLLLETLLSSANCVVTRETLMSQLYGYNSSVADHALTSIVSRLRARLAGLDAGIEIRSSPTIGYVLREINATDEKP